MGVIGKVLKAYPRAILLGTVRTPPPSAAGAAAHATIALEVISPSQNLLAGLVAKGYGAAVVTRNTQATLAEFGGLASTVIRAVMRGAAVAATVTRVVATVPLSEVTNADGTINPGRAESAINTHLVSGAASYIADVGRYMATAAGDITDVGATSIGMGGLIIGAIALWLLMK